MRFCSTGGGSPWVSGSGATGLGLRPRSPSGAAGTGWFQPAFIQIDASQVCSYSTPDTSARPQGFIKTIVSANPINNELAFGEAAMRHWELLGKELQNDVEQFNNNGGLAEFAEPGAGEYRVNNPDSGLEVRIVADIENHIVRYEFLRTNQSSAGAPEGGILSMRLGRDEVEFYSADRPVTAFEARSLLLDPVLNGQTS